MSRFDFRCPCLNCEYQATSFEQLKGHIDGKRPYCSHHNDLPPVKKWEFINNQR